MEDSHSHVEPLLKEVIKKTNEFGRKRNEIELGKTYELMKFGRFENESEHNKNLVIEILRQSICRNDKSIEKLKKWKEMVVEIHQKIEKMEKEETNRKEESSIMIDKIKASKQIFEEGFQKKKDGVIKRESSPRGLIKVREINKRRWTKNLDESCSKPINQHLVFCGEDECEIVPVSVISKKRKSVNDIASRKLLFETSQNTQNGTKEPIEPKAIEPPNDKEEIIVRMIGEGANKKKCDSKRLKEILGKWSHCEKKIQKIVDSELNANFVLPDKIKQSKYIYILFYDSKNSCIGFYLPSFCLNDWKWTLIDDINIFAFILKSDGDIDWVPKASQLPLYICSYSNYGSVLSIGSPSNAITFNKTNIKSDFKPFSQYFKPTNPLGYDSLQMKRIVIYSIN